MARWRHDDRPRRVMKRNPTPFVDQLASRSASYAIPAEEEGASMPLRVSRSLVESGAPRLGSASLAAWRAAHIEIIPCISRVAARSRLTCRLQVCACWLARYPGLRWCSAARGRPVPGRRSWLHDQTLLLRWKTPGLLRTVT